VADGYLPLRPLDGGWQATMDKLHRWLEAAGRDPSTFGIEGCLDASAGSNDDWSKVVEMWRRFGASHLSVSTSGLGSLDEHIRRLTQVRPLVEA
jgi:hypothetical protein